MSLMISTTAAVVVAEMEMAVANEKDTDRHLGRRIRFLLIIPTFLLDGVSIYSILICLCLREKIGTYTGRMQLFLQKPLKVVQELEEQLVLVLSFSRGVSTKAKHID